MARTFNKKANVLSRQGLDLRLQKILRLSQTRLNVGVDLNNLFNANPITAYSPAYATWLRPQSILSARFVKLSAQISF